MESALKYGDPNQYPDIRLTSENSHHHKDYKRNDDLKPLLDSDHFKEKPP